MKLSAESNFLVLACVLRQGRGEIFTPPSIMKPLFSAKVHNALKLLTYGPRITAKNLPFPPRPLLRSRVGHSSAKLLFIQ